AGHFLAPARLFPVKKSTPQTTKSEERILVLEPDESLLSSILSVLHEVAPEAVVDVVHDIDEAYRLTSSEPVELFVLDLDAASDSVPLRDLRASHPKAQAIFLAASHLAAPPEESQATRQQKPDLILLDYLLPDLRGDEVSRRLSEDESTAHIPVIFMSGFAADLGDAQARSENILGILHKPFTSDSLVKAIQAN